MSRAITVYRLGRVEYADGLRLQSLFGEARKADLVGDSLLLLEHSPVLTLGRSGKRANIVASEAELEALGVGIFETNRGGDVTYHGPGQIVGYPIFRLSPDRQDVRRYVRDVEEAMIRTAAHWDIRAGRIAKWAGVWLGDEHDPDARKIAAIGVHIARWQTSHGFALNVNTDLSHFGLIVPCGIQEKGVTSIAREIGRPVPLPEVEDRLAQNFADIFGATLHEGSPPRRTVSVVVTRGEGDHLEILLLKRRPDRGGFWQIVTGRIEAGETPHAVAARELAEETGCAGPVRPLDYIHSFAFGDALPPQVFEETAFAATWPDATIPVRLATDEHTEFAWRTPTEALELLPFEGLKVAVRRAVRGR